MNIRCLETPKVRLLHANRESSGKQPYARSGQGRRGQGEHLVGFDQAESLDQPPPQLGTVVVAFEREVQRSL